MPTISFAGLTFTGDMSTDGFAVARLMGWYDGAPARADIRKRPLADGAFGVNRYYRDARVISVEGDWVGSSMAEAYAARDALSAVQADGVPTTFTVADELGSRSCTVMLDKAPVVDDVLTAPFFNWSFDVVASDPSKYGAAVVASTGLPASGTGLPYPIVYPISYGTPGDIGRLTVVNAGSRESSSLLAVNGGLSGGFELTNVATAQVLRFERDVPVAGVVYLNPRTRRAYLDVPANDVTGFLTRREWWLAAAGSSQDIQFNSIGSVTGTPLLTATTKPAY